jgi:hypothetical protein
MSSIFNMEIFKKDIEKHINQCVTEILDEVIEEARKRVTTEIRSKTGSIAAQSLTFFEFNMDRNRMIITVNVKDLENKQCK